MSSNEIDWQFFKSLELKTSNSVCLTLYVAVEIFVKITLKSVEWMKIQGQLDKGGQAFSELKYDFIWTMFHIHGNKEWVTGAILSGWNTNVIVNVNWP